MRILIKLGLAALPFLPVQAFANDWGVAAHVTHIEVTHAPALLPLQIDTAAGSCAAGSWLYWTPIGDDAAARAQNFEAILAALMSSESTGRQVTVIGSNNGCVISYLYLN